jgi:hypothetical protein
MATSSDEPPGISISPQREVLSLKRCNEIGSERTMALSVRDEESTAAICLILLIRVVVGNNVFEARSFETFADSVEALLEVELAVFRGYIGLKMSVIHQS